MLGRVKAAVKEIVRLASPDVLSRKPGGKAPDGAGGLPAGHANPHPAAPSRQEPRDRGFRLRYPAQTSWAGSTAFMKIETLWRFSDHGMAPQGGPPVPPGAASSMNVCDQEIASAAAGPAHPRRAHPGLLAEAKGGAPYSPVDLTPPLRCQRLSRRQRCAPGHEQCRCHEHAQAQSPETAMGVEPVTVAPGLARRGRQHRREGQEDRARRTIGLFMLPAARAPCADPAAPRGRRR